MKQQKASKDSSLKVVKQKLVVIEEKLTALFLEQADLEYEIDRLLAKERRLQKKLAKLKTARRSKSQPLRGK